jgi:hypothetical protein
LEKRNDIDLKKYTMNNQSTKIHRWSPLSIWRGAGFKATRPQTRKGFLLTTITFAATIATFFNWKTKPKKPATVKFLTQDGKLLDLDLNKLPIAKRMASKEDIKNWIKK